MGEGEGLTSAHHRQMLRLCWGGSGGFLEKRGKGRKWLRARIPAGVSCAQGPRSGLHCAEGTEAGGQRWAVHSLTWG